MNIIFGIIVLVFIAIPILGLILGLILGAVYIVYIIVDFIIEKRYKDKNFICILILILILITFFIGSAILIEKYNSNLTNWIESLGVHKEDFLVALEILTLLISLAILEVVLIIAEFIREKKVTEDISDLLVKLIGTITLIIFLIGTTIFTIKYDINWINWIKSFLIN